MTSLKLSLTPRTLAAVLAGVAVVVAAAGWLLVVGPKRSDAGKLETTVQAKQAELTSAQRAAAATTGASGAQLRTIGKALPDKVVMPQVVDQLNALAKRAGVTLDTITPAAGVAGTGYEAVPLNIVVDGHYFDVERFLHLMRNQVRITGGKLKVKGRLFDVQSVQLQQTEPAPMVTATVGVRAFYALVGSAPAPAAPATTTTSTTGA